MTDETLDAVMTQMRACRVCSDLPLGPKPLFQLQPGARILIAGQAPGSKTHEKGRPFDDASGNRLRDWLGVSRETFYGDPRIGIMPMGLCFPGTGSGGDLPPRPICAQTWRARVLTHLSELELVLIIGRYAIDWHVPHLAKAKVTEAAGQWRALLPASMILPHPSPRNNRWLIRNPWFEAEALPALQARVREVLEP